MAIRFTCEHCGQRLSVDERNAGRRAKCPKCKQALRVPAPAGEEGQGQPASDAAPKEAAEATETESTVPPDAAAENDPYSEFTVYDQWVYDKGESPGEPRDDRSLDRKRVAVSRRVLYMQGILLGVVSLVFFVLGVLVGGAGSGGGGVVEDAPQACAVRGSIAYRSNDERKLPDDGAVIVILPQNARPDPTDKFPAELLRPGSPAPDEDEPLRRDIRALGGDYTRADDDGQFTLQVPDRGRYFVLVLSRRAVRAAGEHAKPTELAQMGRYFLPADQLLGNHRYEWRDETIRRDRTLDIVF